MKIISGFPKKIVEYAHALEHLADHLPNDVKRVLLVTGEKSWQATKEVVQSALSKEERIFERVVVTAYPTQKLIDAFSSVVREQQLEAVIGIGGGRVCDVAKAVANETSAFLMAVPTIAATNAAFRKNSILYEENGAYAGGNQNASTADVLLIDTAIIGAAPRRYLIAGMIDSVSRSVDTRPYTVDSDNFVLAFIHQNAQLATDYLLKISERYAEGELSEAELAQAVDAIITVVGVAGAKSKGRMYRGVTHPLHNELTKLVHHPDILHGEIIAFTTLVQLLLEGSDYEWYLRFLRNLKFYFDIDALGLADEETIQLLAHHFVAHFTEEVAFFITDLSEERVVSAIKEAKQILVTEVFSDGGN